MPSSTLSKMMFRRYTTKQDHKASSLCPFSHGRAVVYLEKPT